MVIGSYSKKNIIMQQCNQYDDMGFRHGYWETYYPNGQLWYKGNFKNGFRDGYWEIYYQNGLRIFSGTYFNNQFAGYCQLINKEHYYARMESI